MSDHKAMYTFWDPDDLVARILELEAALTKIVESQHKTCASCSGVGYHPDSEAWIKHELHCSYCWGEGRILGPQAMIANGVLYHE